MARFLENEPQECLCGLTGPNCTVLDGVKSFSDVASQLCFADGFSKCYKGDCVCHCGWEGDYCETEVKIQYFNIAVGWVLPFALISFSLLWFAHRAKGKNEFDFKKSDCVTSQLKFVSPKAILIYRFCIFLIGVAIQIEQLVKFYPGVYNAFTNWNWTLLTIFFFLGSYLSYQHIYSTAPKDPLDKPTFLDKLYFIIFEVEFSSTLLIFAVVWMFLLPAVTATGDAQALVNPSSFFQHAFNVLFMLIELFLNKLYLKPAHIVFLIVWGALYALFHTTLMVVHDFEEEEHCPIYDFMNLENSLFIVWVIGLMIMFCFFYIMACIISILKKYCLQEDTEEGEKEILGTGDDTLEKASL